MSRWGPDASGAIVGQREVFFEEAKAYVTTNIYDRSKIRAGNRIAGPAVIEEMSATIVVPPGHTACADRYLNLMINYDG